MQWIPSVQPGWTEPFHLKPIIDLLTRIVEGEKVRVVIHTPPRHGKTETLLHFIVWALKQRPDWTFGYASYAENIAYAKARTARDLCLTQPDQPLRSTGLSEWRLRGHRGGMISRGIGGGLTGMGLNVGIVDDPVKDRLQAESVAYKEGLWSWFKDVFFTRIEPDGSVIVNMARWTHDDLAGRLVKELGWEYLCLPALGGPLEDKPLWPERWTLELLREKQRVLGAYGWESLFQGAPRPRDGKLFGDPWGFALSSLPLTARRFSIGIDLSYAARTSSDWSVAVVMCEANGYYWVVDVVKLQVRAPTFVSVVKTLREKWGNPPVRWYASGTEIGVADLFTHAGAPVLALPAVADKFVRAQPYAAQWNAGRVLLQEGADWLDDFVSEHAMFTGLAGGRDDTIDAAVAAYDQLAGDMTYPEEPNWQSTPRRM